VTTRQTHPPSLRTLARRFFTDDYGAETRGARILVATSGGPDSIALLHVLAELRAPFGFTIGAHGVDHGLREGAAAELDHGAAVADACELPFTRERVSVASGANLQARAREARWQSLERAAREGRYDAIATAHHADDRAETVLLRILRGSGARGLAVLPPRSGLRIRPLYRARRSALRIYATRHSLPFADDPSNDEPRFLRARVRH
jgi:tRNA(Ile)-lysidine synthase